MMSKMTNVVMLTLGLACAAPGFALANDSAHRLQMVPESGKAIELEITDPAKVAMFLKEAHKLPPGSLILTMDGTVYVAQDKKLTDGRMLSDAVMH